MWQILIVSSTTTATLPNSAENQVYLGLVWQDQIDCLNRSLSFSIFSNPRLARKTLPRCFPEKHTQKDRDLVISFNFYNVSRGAMIKIG